MSASRKKNKTKSLSVTVTKTKNGARTSTRTSSHICVMVPSLVGQTNILLQAQNGLKRSSPL
jgi:hypothetical protein